MIRFSIILAVGLGLADFVIAAEPPPSKPEEQKPFSSKADDLKIFKQDFPIRIDRKAATEKLDKVMIILPEAFVQDLAKQIKEKVPGNTPGESPLGNFPTSTNLPHGSSIIAGISISLTVMSYVLLRKPRTRAAWLGGAIGVIMLGISAVNFTQANIPLPQPPELLRLRLAEKPPGDVCSIIVLPNNMGKEVILVVPEK